MRMERDFRERVTSGWYEHFNCFFFSVLRCRFFSVKPLSFACIAGIYRNFFEISLIYLVSFVSKHALAAAVATHFLFCLHFCLIHKNYSEIISMALQMELNEYGLQAFSHFRTFARQHFRWIHNPRHTLNRYFSIKHNAYTHTPEQNHKSTIMTHS